MDRTEMVRRVEEVYRILWLGDVDQLAGRLAPDFLDEAGGLLGNELPGAESLRRAALRERSEMQITGVTLDAVVVEGGALAVAATRRGRRIPDGRALVRKEVAIWRFDRQGRLVARNGSTNEAAVASGG